jgi:hypothetical protein
MLSLVFAFALIVKRACQLRYICLSVCLSVRLSVRLSVCPSVCLSLSVCLSVSICLSVCLCVCLSVSICLYVCLSICLSAYLSVCLLSVYLSVSYQSFSVCLSICLSACPPARQHVLVSAALLLAGFSWNLILRDLHEICRETPNFLKIGWQYQALYLTTWLRLAYIANSSTKCFVALQQCKGNPLLSPWQHLMVLYCWKLLVSQQQYKRKALFSRQWQLWLCARATVLTWYVRLLILFTSFRKLYYLRHEAHLRVIDISFLANPLGKHAWWQQQIKSH